MLGPVLMGLVSAALFGLSTPLSKLLLGSLSPFQLAGLLYLGAAIGMPPFVLRARRLARRHPGSANWRRLAAAVFFGGGAAPVLLLLALTTARASSVSLWLNLELVATAVLGSLFFRDHLNSFGWIGLGGAVLAGVLVALGEGSSGMLPAMCAALACLCWGIDNNLTSLIDGLTPQEITFAKGIGAGAVNFCIGSLAAGSMPAVAPGLAALALGAVSYGGSIALYIASAQRLGAARSQIVFASAPFLGTGFSLVLFSETLSLAKIAASVVLVVSVALMGLSRHRHSHVHQGMTHIHAHRHDDLHHGHEHPGLRVGTVHTHEHTHEGVEHAHAHVPDLHHRHAHGRPR